MEADWAVEIGGDAARIEVDWPGFVDLRQGTDSIDRIAEAREFPALRAALRALNEAGSPVFTSKCDVWAMAGTEIDPLEFDSTADEAQVGLASYIDLVAREAALFGSFPDHEGWVRRAAVAVRGQPVRRGRADLVVRAAVASGADGFGVTLYAAGCGADASAAQAAWGEIAGAAVVATMREAWASSSIG